MEDASSTEVALVLPVEHSGFVLYNALQGLRAVEEGWLALQSARILDSLTRSQSIIDGGWMNGCNKNELFDDHFQRGRGMR
jgi:hypothetical protein